MAKRKRSSGRNKEHSGPRDFDPKDARLGPINTYQDVADLEDEYFLNQDTLLLDDEHGSKPLRQDDEMEMSDEEILGYDDSDSDAQFGDAHPAPSKKASAGSKKPATEEHEDGQEDQEEAGWWGSSKMDYYDADKIETEADAQEEEVEAKRIQKKKLAKMQEQDFVFDGDEWLATGGDDDELGGDTFTEVLEEIVVTDDMTSKDRYQLLKTRYPEFEYLVNEFQSLQATLADLRVAAKSASLQSLGYVKYCVLGCYVAALASYFAILAAPARDARAVQKPADPSDLRDHEVMGTLVECRNVWEKVKQLQSVEVTDESDNISIVKAPMMEEDAVIDKRTKRRATDVKVQVAKKARKLAEAKKADASVQDICDFSLTNGKQEKRRLRTAVTEDSGNSDFGEEDSLDARTAADKAARRKSLKFYTSEITRKTNRRAGAGRDAGGDMDLPYRERLRDRQARLLAAAEKRGNRGPQQGEDLGDDSDEGEDAAAAAKEARDDADKYYELIASQARDKKQEKAARYAAYANAAAADRVVETEEILPDGKRKIKYAIEKNKGLAPKRSKEVRNPRVKKRMQYEAKQKKLRSMKPVWSGGEQKGGYQGEQSGINVGVIKSVKL